MNLLRQRIHRAVLVTLDTGDTYRGVLHAQDRHVLVLRNAGQIDPRSDSQFIPADGELVLPRGRITCCQFV